MILKTSNGSVALTRDFAPDFRLTAIPPPAGGYGYSNWSGATVNIDEAYGLPAVAAAIKLISESVGLLPLVVYQDLPGGRQRAVETWQYKLLQQPSLDESAFNFYCDITASLLGFGNAYLYKLKDRSQVVGFHPLMSEAITIGQQDGQKIFKYSAAGKTVVLTTADVVHIRGYSIGRDTLTGVSPITLHRNALGRALSQERFAGSFYKDGARPDVVVSFPQGVTADQAAGWLSNFEARHKGAGNAHKTAVIGGGATLTTVGMSLEDAQFAASQEFSIQEVARMFNVPPTMLTMALKPVVAEDERRRFITNGVTPHLRRIQDALAGDPDIFGSTTLCPVFDTSEYLRADTAALGAFLVQMRQIGAFSINDVRSEVGKAPIEGGDEYQQTPVGGAQNLQPGQATDPVPTGSAN